MPPSLGVSNVPSRWRRVLLPEPLGPASEASSPSSIEKLNPANTSTSARPATGKRFVRFLASRILPILLFPKNNGFQPVFLSFKVHELCRKRACFAIVPFTEQSLSLF